MINNKIMGKICVFLFFLIFEISVAKETYIDTSFNSSDGNGSFEYPFNNIDSIQAYISLNDAQIIIIKNIFFLDKQLIIQNSTINFR